MIDFEDKLVIFDCYSLSTLLIKIKICSYKDVHINVFMFTTNLFKSTQIIFKFKGPNPDNNVIEINKHEASSKFSLFKWIRTRSYICIINDINICKEFFLKIYPFKYKGEVVKNRDPILNKHYLNSNGKISDEEIGVVYKFISIPSNISTQYPILDDSFFIFNKPTIEHCIYNDIERLLNIKCTCKDGYFGVDCSHKLYCSSCSEGYCSKNNQCSKCKAGWKGPACLELDIKLLNICGLHGDLLINETGRFCTCHEGWKGKLCSFSLIEKTKISTLKDDASIPKYDNANNSKIKIVIGAIIASIAVILAIAGIIIFIIKKNT